MKILGWVLVVCGVGVAMGQGPVGAKRAMTFADLMAVKRVSDPQVSASGKWVMFSVTEVSLEKNTKVNHLWVVPVAGGKERQVTSNTGESFGRFSPDGKFVSYTGEATKDDPVARITIAVWDEATGTIGVGRTLKAVSGDADGAIWSPDSKHFLFTTEVWPECSVKGGGRAVADPTLRDGAAKDGAPGRLVADEGLNAGVLRSAQNDTSIVVGGTRDLAGWKGAEAASWAEEDGCDKAKYAAAEADPVKGQVWEGLLYRHWDRYTGEKRSHVLVVNVDGGGASKSDNGVRDLTPAGVVGDAEVPTFSLGGPLGYAWAPDSREVAYVANLDAVPAASTNSDVFTLRLDEVGAKAVRVSTSLGSDDGPAYSPDGRWLAFRSQERAGFESDRFRLVLFDREKGTTKEMMPKLDRWVDEFVWRPHSKGLFFASEDAGETLVGRVMVDGNGAYEPVFGVGRMYQRVANYAGISDLRISPDGWTMVACEMHINMPTTVMATDFRVVEQSQQVQWPPFVEKELQDQRNFSVTNGTPIPSAWNRQRVLTHVNDDLVNQLSLPDLEAFQFIGAEGTPVEGFILRPPGFVEGKKYPVKFVMHGGPQTALGDSWSYRWNWELMAASGYVVVGINRRGSTGYGQKFIDEVSGDWGGRAYEDLMKGLDYAEGHFPFIDKTRECALGASYGGFMADWVLTHTDRFKCIVTHDGMVDPVGAYGSTEELWFNEWEFRRPEDFPKGWDGFLGVAKKRKTNTEIPGFARNDASIGMKRLGDVGADGHAAEPWRYASLPAEEDPFRQWSPMRFIERAKTPTLVIHSQKDYRLDVSQGLELFTALQRLGVPSKMLYFPDEGHWVLKPQNSQLWYDEVGDWCDQWTKTGRYGEQGSGIRD
ncbi:MAG TPA: S9 family peptidase [Acidobacteriaceae bacterium]|nr:S9 family peptidase [Acidobacteriaceae bacterium]